MIITTITDGKLKINGEDVSRSVAELLYKTLGEYLHPNAVTTAEITAIASQSLTTSHLSGGVRPYATHPLNHKSFGSTGIGPYDRGR
ncbi:hypothetical protein SAMN05660772_01840 [Pasteurella testudinis DSM 23072]|uniref:Uncharacterized protein n=1 Tax=Pasteurella testudinis DSM 23072 TaxID=1122938 RepID=A0A1W1UK69_9PAST|nr:hypothetical protein [Pasteurella testudinis]SMB81413.1 hypothetical protein SAMN05660772_01840 [Pasteurella testudinis DSM 23072]SUB51398.1 Uncharacterised protein [Pasteurella testudinis]